jgi:hypothetical protein
MVKDGRVSIPSLTETAKHVAERLSGLVGEAERRRVDTPAALDRIASVIREVAAAANTVAPESSRLLGGEDLRRMKELFGPADGVALVMGRGHVVAGLLKFEATPDGYIEATMKTWRSSTAPVERIIGRFEPQDEDGHNRAIQRFLLVVDREMGNPPLAAVAS